MLLSKVDYRGNRHPLLRQIKYEESANRGQRLEKLKDLQLVGDTKKNNLETGENRKKSKIKIK